MHRTIIILLILCALAATTSCTSENKASKGLKDDYATNYLIGAAIFPEIFNDPKTNNLLKKHFNSITPENDMKWERIHPTLDEYTFDRADIIVAYALANKMSLIGHTLVWHSQLGKGVFYPENSSNDTKLVDSATLMNRIKDHITKVVGRYQGKIHAWDVVNEALNDDGSLRESHFLKIAGEEYIQKTFEFANEADPEAELYYNDYNMVEPAKRDGAIRLVKKLQHNGIRIDGIGMQAHWELNYPSLEKIEESIIAFSQLGVKVMITELDISVLPSPWRMPSADISIRFENNEMTNPYPEDLPDSIGTALAKRYREIFSLFNKHADKISRVTFWGLYDGKSWKNNFPIKGRTDYPLLFDRNMKKKKAYHQVAELMN